MSDFSQSTLTSPRSPLFSDSDPPERQSGSEIVTSDEEPDLGAFTAVLRAWGYLQPPLRIPTHFPSSSSSRTRSTPTTITGYPGFGGGDSETVEGSTVWNRIPIQSYFRHIYGTESSSGRTERARGSVLEELEDEELLSSPPPSPASEGARTVEIASEADVASVRSVTYEDGASGERLVVPIATPPSTDGRTVSVASGHESHDEQATFTSRPSGTPISSIHPFNDNTLSSLSSVSPIPSQSNSVSNQPLDDNTTISRQRPYPSTLSIVSYQPQMSAVRTLSSVFQESPSPALLINSGPPFRETTTSSPPATPLDLALPSTRRVISNSSNAESDIINSYYTQGPGVSSPSTDQPASDFPWPRRLEIITQPPSSSSHHPLLEQDDSPTAQRQTPSVIDDNSSTSAVTEYTPPPSATTSAALSVLQEILTATAESSGVSSSHSLTPSHTIVFPTAPASTSTSTSTSVSTITTATANPTRQASLESPTVYTRQHPSLASTYREQQSRTRSRIDTSTFQDMQSISSQPRYHLLSPEGGPEYEQPSLGYLDEALSFIAAERARWTAAREAGLHRGPSPQRQEEEQSEESGASRENETWGYAIESQRAEKRKKRQLKSNNVTVVPATPTSTVRETLSSSTDADGTSEHPHTSSSSNNPSSTNENVVILNTPKKKNKKKKNKASNNAAVLASTNGAKPISILKRPENTTTALGTSPSNSKNSLPPHSLQQPHSHSHANASAPHAHGSMSVGAGAGVSSSPSAAGAKFDGSATPRAHGHGHERVYSWSSDNHDSIDDDDDDNDNDDEYEYSYEEGEGEGGGYPRPRGPGGGEWYIDKYGRRGRRADASRSYIHLRNQDAPFGAGLSAYQSTPNISRYAGRCKVDLGWEYEEGEEDFAGGDGNEDLSQGRNRVMEEEDNEEGDEGDSYVKEKEKKKKKKAKKRKLPVTAPLAIPTTLAHSRSVPDLRAEAVDTTDDGGELDIEVDSSGIDLPGLAGAPFISPSSSPKKKKKKGKKAVDSLVFRGTPSNNSAAAAWLSGEGEGGLVQSKQTRLVSLARHLQILFPEEREPLRKVIKKLDGLSAEAAAEKKKKKKKGGRALLDDCSFDYSSLADSDLQRAGMEEDPDPRGDAPGRKDTLVHVFIDHSNILIGLLSHIKRMSRKSKQMSPSALKPLITYPLEGTNNASTSKITGSRPLPIPKTKAGVPILAAKPLIPLPSFATANLSRSAPSTPHTKLAGRTRGNRKDTISDGDVDADDQGDDMPMLTFDEEGYGYEKFEEGEQGAGRLAAAKKKKKSKAVVKRAPRHLWHAALALILERGRPITRRVVAASSPLYQPMDNIERLGYEVKIFKRVPDLGDGADRSEKAAKYDHYNNKDKDSIYNRSPTKGPSSPTRTIGYGSLGKKTHVNRFSGSMGGNTELGASSPAAASTSGQQNTSTRVKYREQGVDEFLQLKLHQAIVATDDIPEGATIILATGDGNVGQFNEEGFLGSVRTALRRGWRVELYAWEDGLSRSWEREFGPSSEWGRKGMFRIIAMEQFAECLVDFCGS